MARGDQTALITGASSGLGREFAEQLAQRGFGLVLVARDEGRLGRIQHDLISRYALPVEVMSADLTTASGVESVERRLRHRPVRVLVNNAGFGLRGAFGDESIDDEEHHLNVHVRAPMRLMHAAIETMREGGRGTIINVASVAAFTPRSTYGAVKAWSVSISQWANAYLKEEGIDVTAVCPGFVHTEFHARLGADGLDVPEWMWLMPAEVVSTALRDAGRGKALSVPSWRYRALSALARTAPAALVQRAAARGR